MHGFLLYLTVITANIHAVLRNLILDILKGAKNRTHFMWVRAT